MKLSVERGELTATLTLNEKQLQTVLAVIGDTPPYRVDHIMDSSDLHEFFREMKAATVDAGIEYMRTKPQRSF